MILKVSPERGHEGGPLALAVRLRPGPEHVEDRIRLLAVGVVAGLPPEASGEGAGQRLPAAGAGALRPARQRPHPLPLGHVLLRQDHPGVVVFGDDGRQHQQGKRINPPATPGQMPCEGKVGAESTHAIKTFYDRKDSSTVAQQQGEERLALFILGERSPRFRCLHRTRREPQEAAS
ncbi:hypothetical protein CEXT_544941 [Caerostris extrusa]|uniref:Uncharacterized protein n=1 Tax=Caerostris extrusa TaxID=172846 RepID=A0AAV4MPK5_CAEEX|nr:hypothetical protein CEXT_544941 [Caerostris extrusa]